MVNHDWSVKEHYEQADRFMDAVFGLPFEQADVFVSLWTKTRGQHFTKDLRAAARKAVELGVVADTHIRISGMAKKPEKGRGKAEDSSVLTALFADVDCAHAGVGDPAGLPPDQKTAREILDRFPVKPPVVVSSGNGLHAYWPLEDPILITSGQELAVARDTVRKLGALLKRHFADHGFRYDTGVHELARLLRPPGTFNFKKPDDPLRVELLRCSGDKVALRNLVPAEPSGRMKRNSQKGTGSRRAGGTPVCNAIERCCAIRVDDQSDGSRRLIRCARIVVQQGLEALQEVQSRKPFLKHFTDEELRTRVKDARKRGRIDRIPDIQEDDTAPAWPELAISESVSLIVTRTKETDAKRSIHAEIVVLGEPVSGLTITSAKSNQDDALRTIQRAASIRRCEVSRSHAEETVAKLFTSERFRRLEEQIEKGQACREDPPSMHEIVREHAAQLWEFTFNTPEGSAWSETAGREFRRGEFTDSPPAGLEELCRASLARPEQAKTANALLIEMRAGLRLAWQPVLAALPREADSALHPESNAADRFRKSLLANFFARSHWERPHSRDSGRTRSLSLADILVRMSNEMERENQMGWTGVDQVFGILDVFLCRLPDNAFSIGLTQKLFPQVQSATIRSPKLAGVESDQDLFSLARGYGIALVDAPPEFPPEYQSRGRITVLSREFTSHILRKI